MPVAALVGPRQFRCDLTGGLTPRDSARMGWWRPMRPAFGTSWPAGCGPSCHDRDMTGRTGSAEIVELGSVPGFVVFDLPGAPLSAGGTRLAPDVSVAEVAVLARSMTYKFAALGERVG